MADLQNKVADQAGIIVQLTDQKSEFQNIKSQWLLQKQDFQGQVVLLKKRVKRQNLNGILKDVGLGVLTTALIAIIVKHEIEK